MKPYLTCMPTQNAFTVSEFIILCLTLPTFIWATNSGHMMFGFLWVAFAYTGLIWWRLKDNSKIWDAFKTEWNWGAITAENVKSIFIK